ncbi:cytidine deaminase-like protein [Hymenopellis radicata]|nr:cytidine deaminase-like protein [Hymenopellis radicata]
MDDQQLKFMQLALAEAEKCEPSPTAFCVGCVLVLSDTVLATGFSRELPGNTHAEANALAKLRSLTETQLASILSSSSTPSIDYVMTHLDVYTTLEPCSVRTSGLAPCADALIAAKIKRCYIGVGEPDDFVTCQGARKLIDAGIEVIWVKGLEVQSLQAARRGHGSK